MADLEIIPMGRISVDLYLEQISVPLVQVETFRHATVAAGNRDEVEVAVGTRYPLEASAALLDLGIEFATVKQGPKSVLARTAEGVDEVLPIVVEVVNGLGGRGRLRGRLVPRATLGVGSGAHSALRQRRRRHRRLPPGVRERHAYPRRGGGTGAEVGRCLT